MLEIDMLGVMCLHINNMDLFHFESQGSSYHKHPWNKINAVIAISKITGKEVIFENVLITN